ncbi:phosphoribosyltransferase-like protein [Elizabethkingia anophelis]|uniref:phosphoribosyltransferase-like protein n=1 Tax=Elizabethkingia anophelis TaxID=1117645 RepID=UPI000C6E8AA5|nr:hypothetical protein [Elizabethkingia anophelis]PKR31024.1 hypothetical protein CWH99_09520 [Elizabethkingia anophelis]PKR35762.1 hypothetical protein CWI00_01065 [Elizabethkingia anophelis]PRQ79799.1 hypothetical protein CMT60_06080 [Elizabethkingia anophelis]PRQ85660.1 hypothetical protein CMT87_05830 [Elizabethkingia anophelis]PRQ87609.1 hypothetical protein CMT86_12140 [Elizabethkingia anophelis]
MNEQLANAIYEVIKDYRNHDNFHITPKYILDWANQFGNDSTLVLTELDKIIPEVYVSRQKAKGYIKEHLESYLHYFGYTNMASFLMDTEFLDVQASHKSQPAILELLEEVLGERYSESYHSYTTFPKKNYIYFDDVLASGSTIGRDTVQFLNRTDANGKAFSDKLLDNEIRLIISVFCIHTWGFEFQKYRIEKTFSDKVRNKIFWSWSYEVQNHAKFNNQKLNIAKPIKENNVRINGYLENLSAPKHEDYAYRNANAPAIESFFTSPENRNKFETLLVEKGLDIIEMIQGEVKTNIRPLGLINPEYKIFGLGTHFFTWRNIPNNSPLVYWWEVQGHDWIPLFPVANRG